MVCRVSNLTLRQKKKWFAECFSKIHSAKDYCLPSVFGITLGKPIFQRKKIFFLSILLLFAECFLKLHSANLFSKEKKIFAGLDWNSSSSDSVR